MDGEVTGEVLGVGLGKPGPSDDAGVVDQDVEASELLDGRIDERLPPATVATSLSSAIAAPPAATISSATRDATPASAPTPSIDPPRSLTTTLAPRSASSRA